MDDSLVVLDCHVASLLADGTGSVLVGLRAREDE
jgi:hypothetical protein